MCLTKGQQSSQPYAHTQTHYELKLVSKINNGLFLRSSTEEEEEEEDEEKLNQIKKKQNTSEAK